MGRTFEKLTIYAEEGTDRQYALTALRSAAKWPDSDIVGFSYGEPVHTNVTLKRNKAGITVWVYAP